MLKGRNTGRMRVPLLIQQLVLTRNSINEDELSWVNFANVFAERVWEPMPEKFDGKQETDILMVQFNARYISNVTTTMRLKQSIENDYFYITNVRNSPREGLMVINAERRDNMNESYILREDGTLVLQEDGYEIRREESL